MSIQKLTIHSSSEETSLFCPACGTLVLSPQDEAPEYCPHVEFVYVSEAGEFTHITPELEEKVEAWRSAAEGAGEDESEDEFDPVAALAAGLDGDDRFIWESPEPGRCGEPGTITVWVGFRCNGGDA